GQLRGEWAGGTGRDHNAYGFTMWMAGGGVQGGISVGTTDELGAEAVEHRFHVKNLHATILTLMGLDPDRLSYFYGGLDQKLVGVEGADGIRRGVAWGKVCAKKWLILWEGILFSGRIAAFCEVGFVPRCS